MLLFLVDLINIEIFRISFCFFYLFSFILRSRATSVCIVVIIKFVLDQEMSGKLHLKHKMVCLSGYSCLLVCLMLIVLS